MPQVRSDRRSLRFALAAIVGLLAATDGASGACSMTVPGDAACTEVCNCCQTDDTGIETTGFASVEAKIAASDQIASDAKDCCCKSQNPPASGSRQERSSEGRRVETGTVEPSVANRSLEFARSISRTRLAAEKRPVGPPRLYLRLGRILI